MKKKIYTRLATGLLCGALLLTDAASLDVWAVSNDWNEEQTASLSELNEESDTNVIRGEGEANKEAENSPEKEAEEEKTESTAAEETDAEEAENPDQDAEAPEGDDVPVKEGDDEVPLPVEEEKEFVSDNTVEEDVVAEDELDVNSVMTASEEKSGDIPSGKSNDISWEIDADGKLTVNGNGDWENKTVDSHRWTPWYDDRESIKTAEINVTNMTDTSYMFYDCENLTDIDPTNFRSYNVTNMASMFSGCTSLTTPNLSNFYSGCVTDMSEMFYGCVSLTELDAYGLIDRSVTSTRNMFAGCTALTNLDFGGLLSNDSNLNDMSGMFQGCSNLHSLEFPMLKTDGLADMSSMFSGCKSLQELNLNGFNTDRVTNMKDMFSDCIRLEKLDLSNLNTDSVTNQESMFDFNDCGNLTVIYTPRNLKHSVKLPGGTWYLADGTNVTELPKNLANSVALKKNETPKNIAEDTSGDVSWVIDANGKLTVSGSGDFERKDSYDVPWRKYYDLIKTAEVTVTDMTDASYMFYGCRYLTTIDLTKFDTGKVTNMKEMFSGCEWLEKLELSNFKTGNVTDMSAMFHQCYKLTTLDLSKFDTGKVTDMEDMFSRCNKLKTLNISSFNTCNVTNMSAMFYECRNLSELDLSNFITGSVENMRYMFSNCNELSTLNLINFDTSKVTDMRGMFEQCYELAPLDLYNFDTGSVTDMSSMFYSCRNLPTLDLSSFDTSSVTNMGSMLYGCENLTTIYTPRNVKQNVNLPSKPGDKWYRSDGTVVTELPRNLSDSVALGRNHTPTEKTPEENDPSDDDPSDDDPNDDNGEGVDPKDIPQGGIPNGLWISEIEDQTYTGAAIKPEVRVYDGEKRLKQGTDYTLSYQNNTKAAQPTDTKPPTVVVKSKGNYAGTEPKTFTIAKRNISDAYVTKTFTDAYATSANGNNPKLVFGAKCNNKALKQNTDYTLTVKDSAGNEVTSYAAEGSYTAVVKGTGTNYTGEYSFSFAVLNKIPVSKLNIGKIAAVEYDGTGKTPEPVIKYGRVTLTKGTDYNLSYLNNTAKGTATVIIEGKGDYFGTRNVTFSIIGLQIKNAKFTGFKTSFPYTGNKVYQTEAVLKHGEKTLVKDTDYTVSYSNCLNKGKVAVTYTGIGKYTGTIKKTYSITAYNIAKDDKKRISLQADNISAAYTKGGARPSLKVYDKTRLLTEGKDYTLSYQNNTAVTTPATVKQPTITVKGKGNYAGAFAEKKTFTITPKAITEVTVTAPDVIASTKVGKYKSTPVLTDTDGKKLSAGKDYDKTYTYTYKDTTAKVLSDGTEVTRNADDPVEEKDIVPANTVLCVRIKAKEGGNYTGEKTAEYRIVTSLINKAKITVQNPAQNNANLFPYTGQEIRIDKSNLIVKVGTEVLSGDQYEILENTYKNNVNKGTASVQIRGVGNIYGGTATVKFRIGTKGFQWFWRLFG